MGGWGQGIDPIEMHTCVIQRTCTNMLMSTVFIIKNWKLKWINNGGIVIYTL